MDEVKLQYYASHPASARTGWTAAWLWGGRIPSQRPLNTPGSGHLHVNSMSTAPLSARLKKETPAQLVVAQELSWSGR